MVLDEQIYQLAITRIDGVGDSLAKNLISYCGSAAAVFTERKFLLTKIPGIGRITSENISKFKAFDDLERELQLLKKMNIRVLFFLDKDYPSRLRNFEDSPTLLFYKGKADLNANRILSIVGTRKSTPYGKMFIDQLMRELQSHHVLVVSGLASGTDTNAHRASLKNGIPTVGVLGHGFSTLYPGANKGLSEEMLRNGGLLTEFSFYQMGKKENFPKRNRIVAGICDALIVVESGVKGGSLITADIANSYNRDVFALPGKISDTWSRGCNKLIHYHEAAIINDIEELIHDLGYSVKKKNQDSDLPMIPNLSDEENIIFQILSSGNKGIDELHFQSGLPMNKLAFVLINLEFRNIIHVLPGKTYAVNK